MLFLLGGRNFWALWQIKFTSYYNFLKLFDGRADFADETVELVL